MFPIPLALHPCCGFTDSVAFGCAGWILGRVHQYTTFHPLHFPLKRGPSGCLVGGWGALWPPLVFFTCILIISYLKHISPYFLHFLPSYIYHFCYQSSTPTFLSLGSPWGLHRFRDFWPSWAICWTGSLFYSFWHTFYIILFTQAGPWGWLGVGRWESSR